MSDDLRTILHAAAQVLPPLFKYGPAPIRHRLYPGLVLLASRPDEGSGEVGEHAALLFEPITPEHNREISETLYIAGGTVKNHLSNILGKLGVRDRTQAALKARELGLL